MRGIQPRQPCADDNDIGLCPTPSGARRGSGEDGSAAAFDECATGEQMGLLWRENFTGSLMPIRFAPSKAQTAQRLMRITNALPFFTTRLFLPIGKYVRTNFFDYGK